MGNLRGLRTRSCPRCEKITPHRTLYARTTSDGRSKWFQLFWVCTECGSLNHILLPAYRIESASLQLPSALTVGIVNVLAEGWLDFDELTTRLRQKRIPDVRHIFKSEVQLALDYLRGHGVIAESACDRTERAMDVLKDVSAKSRQLGRCPEERNHRVAGPSLVALYSQRRASGSSDNRLTAVGTKCLNCSYYHLVRDALW